MPNQKIKKKTIRQKESSTRNQSITYRRISRRRKWFRNFEGREKSGEQKLEVFRRMIKNCLIQNIRKVPQYREAWETYKNAQIWKQVEWKLFWEGKNAHTKHKKNRKKGPTQKIIGCDINEIWSLDLAHKDKLAKENKDVKYLFDAVDCLSSYLRVELLKSKYATKTADAFKKW